LEDKRWYCYTCGWNAKIEQWQTELSQILGDSYVCKCCGVGGHMLDPDAPKMIADDQKENESSYSFGQRIFGF
jgi:hypothetical protein